MECPYSDVLLYIYSVTQVLTVSADDMGLGKTLTMISLMMKDNETHRVSDERQHKGKTNGL